MRLNTIGIHAFMMHDGKLKTTTRRVAVIINIDALMHSSIAWPHWLFTTLYREVIIKMLIPITITSSSPSNPKLPSGLAKISHNEVVLVELQGSLEVECNQLSERDGKLVGKLKIDDLTVIRKKKTLLSIIYFIVSYNRENRACSLDTIS